ncbi:hypothetical protein [Nitrospirillum iridis]|uniref:Uncharacterized protein n=1 Tax=Nitrospirillum iridis TaxID=765888 RepID=A0A7X0B388_9PROT|nr:hypothetical protein [Nitrospirillum iridis]MBB6254843.1 hypothetical protein [Nitrospirillum iridis]
MDARSIELKKKLKKAGLSDQVVEAAWPAWWSDEAADSISARAELRFGLSRKLGISPKALSEDRVEFVWRDAARFKHLSGEDLTQRAALESFGISVARIIFQGFPEENTFDIPSAKELRSAVLMNNRFVDLSSLIALCWGLGIPVIHLRVFVNRRGIRTPYEG